MKYLFLVLMFSTILPMSAAAETFSFQNISDLESMSKYISTNFALGSRREDLQKTFVQEGGATLIVHPENSMKEKYIYDINLCSWYVWRWNISALYNSAGELVQAYLNGEPVFAKGPQIVVFDKDKNSDGKMKISRISTPRPEASKGEKELASIVFDKDGSFKTLEDQELMGAGPSRPDPINMGKMHVYRINSIWGSIFDHDKSGYMAPYAGDCKAVDAAMEKMKKQNANKN